MTGNILIRSCRVLLRDDGRGLATDGRDYTTEEIILALTAARNDTIDILLSMCDVVGAAETLQDFVDNQVGGMAPVRRPRITLSRLLIERDIAASPTLLQPTDYKIECGVDLDGLYVPYQPTTYARPLEFALNSVIYANGGFVYTNMPLPGKYYVWCLPEDDIAETDDNISDTATGLTDAFYHTVKYLACRNLLMKKNKEAANRIAFCIRMYERRLRSLR